MKTKEYNPLEHSVVQAILKADATHHYEVSDFAEALISAIHRELEWAYWNWNQESLENRKDWQLTGLPGGFEYRRYYWGDCDCGAESPVHSADCRRSIDGPAWVERRLDETCGPPEYMDNGFPLGHSIRFDKFDEWEEKNPHPPCTCGAAEGWQEKEEHLPTCSPSLPNMKFGPVVINWYKHMGRGMSTNVDWDERQWREWFDDALRHIRLYDVCMDPEHHKLRDEDAGLEPFSSEVRVQCKDCKYCL